MSKGNPIVKLRLPPATLAKIEAMVERSKEYMTQEEYTVSSWIRAAIAERFKKYERAKSAAKRKAAARRAAKAPSE